MRGSGLVLLGLLVWSAEPARAIECPTSQPATTKSALAETTQDIQTLSDLMAEQGTGVVPEIIAQLRQRYPTAQDAEIANYLVTVYCPVLDKDAALSDAEKADRLSAFSSQIMQSLANR